MSRIEKQTASKETNFEKVGVGFDSTKITGGISGVLDFDYPNDTGEVKRFYISLLPVDKDRIMNEYDGNLKQKYAKMSKAELADARAKLPSYNITMTKEAAKALGSINTAAARAVLEDVVTA